MFSGDTDAIVCRQFFPCWSSIKFGGIAYLQIWRSWDYGLLRHADNIRFQSNVWMVCTYCVKCRPYVLSTSSTPLLSLSVTRTGIQWNYAITITLAPGIRGEGINIVALGFTACCTDKQHRCAWNVVNTWTFCSFLKKCMVIFPFMDILLSMNS